MIAAISVAVVAMAAIGAVVYAHRRIDDRLEKYERLLSTQRRLTDELGQLKLKKAEVDANYTRLTREHNEKDRAFALYRRETDESIEELEKLLLDYERELGTDGLP